MRRALAGVLVLLLVTAGGARAQEKGKAAPPAAAAAPQARKVVVAPLTALGEAGANLAPVQAQVATGVATVPGVTMVSDKDLRAALKKAKRKDLEACEGAEACLAELGKLVGADVVIAGEVGELGDGQVAYLKAVDALTGKEIGSTTALMSGEEAARQLEARAAAYRLLAPGAYVGTLTLAIDVPGALVYVDGKQVGKSPTNPLQLGVGTHALRVTHEKYRDFVRFVDVKFDETTKLPVPLTEFPIVSDKMIEKDRRPRQPAGPTAPLPWYRTGWFVAGGAAVVLVGTALVVGYAVGGFDSDREVTVKGGQ